MYWTKENTNIALFFSLAVLLVHILMFIEYVMPLPILFVGLCVLFFFYIALRGYFVSWENVEKFKNKLFLHSLIYRFLAVIAMYLLTMTYDPANLPLEISASDSWNYHYSGIIVADAIYEEKNIFGELSTFWKSESDYGFSILIGFLYAVFGKSTLVIKIFNILIGSITVVRIYQITRFLYDEKRARLAGILAMLMPSLLWFGGMLLKETVLIFLIVNTGYLVLKTINIPKFRLVNFVIIVLQITITLYFRTFIAPLLLICVLLQIVFLKTRKENYRILSLCIGIGLIWSSYMIADRLGMTEGIESIIASSEDQFGNELEHSAKTRNISYSQALVAPLLLAGAIITPFPSVLDFEKAQLGIFVHFQNEIIRNCLYFFMFFGLFKILKQRKKGMIFITFFPISYILILAISGVSFQDRFQVLALPFLIIFMSDGIISKYPKKERHWSIYLAFIFLAILMWNIFKLTNRGLI